MSNEPNLYTCPVCDKKFQMEMHRYEGKWIPTYKITVCSSCYRNNWDGWQPQSEEKVTEVLRSEGLPGPTRNSKQLRPRG